MGSIGCGVHMKKGSVIKKLWLMLNANINSYVPRRVACTEGQPTGCST